MTLQKKIENKIRDKKGVALIGVLLAAMAFGIIAVPMTKWVIQMTQTVAISEKNMDNLSERMEMQSIIQDFWYQINNAPWEEFEDKIKTKGKTWTEDIAGKYTMNVAFGNEGKYESAACNTSKTPVDDDRHCRSASITLTSKADVGKVETLNATKVSSPSEIESLKALEVDVTGLKGRMSTTENKFNSYYTKTESNNNLYTKTQISSTLGNYYTRNETYSRDEVDSKDTTVITNVNNKFKSYDTKTQVDDKLAAAINGVGTVPDFEDDDGYIEFDNGFIIQYGKIEDVSLAEAWHTITFPKKFPTAALSINATISPEKGTWLGNRLPDFVNGGAAPYIKKDSLSQTGATIGVDISDGNITPTKAHLSGTIYWTAFGY